MKTRRNLPLCLVLLLATNAQAVSLTWDTTTGDSLVSGGNGNWNTTSTTWTADAGASNIAWPSVSSGDDDAIFDGIGGTIAVQTAGVTANDVTFNVADYVLNGGFLLLDGAAPKIIATADATINTTLAGSNGLVKSGAGILTLTAANTYTGNTTVEQGSLILSGGSNRISTLNNIVFSGNSFVDFDENEQTIANLQITTATVSTVGALDNGKLTINGASDLTVSPTILSGNTLAEVDATLLTSLSINKPANTFNIGGRAGATASGSNGMFKLSATENNIIASAINVGITGGGNVASAPINKGEMQLGAANILRADNWTLGNTRDGGIIRFKGDLVNPSATLRATNGTSPITKITIGQNGAGATGVGISSLELANGSVDILANEIVLSRGFSASSAANTPAVNGYFSFGGGTVVANTVWLSKNEAGGRNSQNTSHLYHLGGNAKINSVVFGQTTHTGAVTSATTGITYNAQYTLSAGELRAAEIKAGTGSFWTASVRRINFNGGTIANFDATTDLTINGVTGTGGSIGLVLGTTGSPTLHADADRSVSVGAFTSISGTGSLTKTGTGTVTLAGPGSFTGDTKAMAGSLVIANSTALSGSTLDLAATNLGTVSFSGITALTLGSIKGTQSLTLQNATPAAIALTVGQNNQSTVYTGDLTGSSAIRKIGTGIWEYDPGTDHTSTLAGLNVSGGTLHLKSGAYTVTGSAGTAQPDSMAGFIVSRGGTLRLDGASISATGGAYVFPAGNTLGGANNFILDSGSFDGGTREVLNAYGATGTVTINGGVFAAGEFRVSQSATGTVNLNGGVLRVTKIKHSNNVEILNFNGGTLQARANVIDFITAENDNAWIKENGLIVDTNGFNVTIPKLLATDVTSVGGGLTKAGNGMLTLTAANTYTGVTSIKQGDLRINVDHSSATGNVIVGDDEGDFGSAILSGNGIVGGPITLNIDGAIAPGNGLGVLSTGFNVSGEGELTMQLDGAVADTLVLTGSGVIDISELNLNLSVISDPTQTSYILVESASAITGSAFASVSGLPAGYAVVYDNTLHQIRIEGTPPAAGYDAFADTITDVTKRGELDDADSDGISNLIEYVLAGNPNLSDRQILPAFATTATNAVFTFKRSDDSENDTTQTFQWSTDLQNWNDVALGAATAGIVSVVENESAADDITVTITKGTNTKVFGRVKIDKP